MHAHRISLHGHYQCSDAGSPSHPKSIPCPLTSPDLVAQEPLHSSVPLQEQKPHIQCCSMHTPTSGEMVGCRGDLEMCMSCGSSALGDGHAGTGRPGSSSLCWWQSLLRSLAGWVHPSHLIRMAMT